MIRGRYVRCLAASIFNTDRFRSSPPGDDVFLPSRLYKIVADLLLSLLSLHTLSILILRHPVSSFNMYLYPLVFLLTAHIFSLVHSYRITGATGGVDAASGRRPSRLEFSTLAASGEAFDLYVLALRQFAQDNQANLLSYYQVAGRSYRVR